MIKFEWDQAKAASNKKKHGVSFDEAKSVFYDEFAVQFFDEESSESEDRKFILIPPLLRGTKVKQYENLL